MADFKTFVNKIRADGCTVTIPKHIINILQLHPRDYVKIIIEKMNLEENEKG